MEGCWVEQKKREVQSQLSTESSQALADSQAGVLRVCLPPHTATQVRNITALCHEASWWMEPRQVAEAQVSVSGWPGGKIHCPDLICLYMADADNNQCRQMKCLGDSAHHSEASYDGKGCDRCRPFQMFDVGVDTKQRPSQHKGSKEHLSQQQSTCSECGAFSQAAQAGPL